METILQIDTNLESDIRYFDSYWKARIIQSTQALIEQAQQENWKIHGDLEAALKPQPTFEGTTHKDRLFAQKLFFNAQAHPHCRKRINHFYRFFFRTFLPGKVLLYVAKPGKRAVIQSRRNAWITMRDEAERLRLAYVNEKGDFYKT